MNLDTHYRNDFITVDSNLTPVGKKMINLLKPGSIFTVQAMGKRNAVKADLFPHEIAIFKLI